MSEQTAATAPSGQTDFDFFIGTWTCHHRRLTERLKGSTTWEEFDGMCVARHLWGGRANVDEVEADSARWGHIQGLTLRLFEPATRQWRIHWANSARGVLDVPMIGGFKDGWGEFYAQELLDGRAIYSRFIWRDITPTSCHWEQAFSADGAKTWETNWTMDFTRVE